MRRLVVLVLSLLAAWLGVVEPVTGPRFLVQVL